MSDLQFDGSANEFGAPPSQSIGTDITGKIVAWGLASNREQAQYVLVGVVAVLLVLAFILYKMVSGGSSAPPLLPQ
jgi:hypothetical protein